MPRRTVLNVLGAFAVSRAAILLLLVIGSQMSFIAKEYYNTIWRTEVSLSAKRLQPELLRMAMVGDAWYYRQIAISGYEPRSLDGRPKNTWAFFPAYPLLVRALGGGDGTSFSTVAVVTSNVALLAALFAVAATGRELGASDDDVERATWYLALFPTSYFFSLPMTESVFLLLSAATFLAAARQRWWAAGVLGALTSATRVVGICLLPALLLLPFQRGPRPSKQQLWMSIVPLGVATFIAFLYLHTGDPLAFIHAQTLWGRGSPAASDPIVQHGLVVSKTWNFVALNLIAAILMIAAGCAFLARRQWSYAAYTLLSVAIPLSTGSLQSISRYALVDFPMFYWLASICRTPSRDRAMIATFVILLGWLIALFTLRIDFALA